ncbi:MAG TPA: NAD-dependent epimerase/dehydratase family protein, partial [Actinomycetes bacterium]|nr:NAD-dependent epimerase/dehydratase family protein [Actinomycetes bacterium]
MTSPFLVTGGTGTLGRLVVPRLRDAGAEVRVLSRRPHEPADGVEFAVGDLATGEGLDAAVDGIGTIVHC